MHNILTPALLFEGVAKTLGKNEKAMQFQVDRSAGSTLDTKSVGKLSSMSHREYVYDEECVFEALLLRQHTGLGAGLRVEAPSLRKPSALPFKPPKLLGEAGVTCQPVFNADGARMTAATAAAAADAARAAKGGAPGGGCSGADQPLAVLDNNSTRPSQEDELTTELPGRRRAQALCFIDVALGLRAAE